MKSLLAVVLVLVLAFSTSACGGDAGENNNSPSPSQTGGSESPAANGKQPESEISFEQLVVADNEECAISITSIEPDNMWGYTLKVLLENKSADKIYMFSVESASVNGVQSDPFFASEVASGKKANEDISFADSTLNENGIKEYTDIELTFRVYDTDDWTADEVAYETVHVYPYGEDKATAFVREP